MPHASPWPAEAREIRRVPPRHDGCQGKYRRGFRAESRRIGRARYREDQSRCRAADIDRIIHSNLNLAEALDIRGTPALIIGDILIPGAVDLDTLREDIAAARRGS